MTLIALAKGLVVADSARGTPHGIEYQTGKIITYPTPIQLRSKRLGFKDWFYGFAGTGDEEIVRNAGEMALIGSLDLWWDRFKSIDEMRFINTHTSCSLMLYGLDGVVLLDVESGKINMRYLRYCDFTLAAIGSGGRAYQRLFDELGGIICPVRCAYGSFAMEPTCGGEVEVWRLPLAARGKGKGMIKLDVLPHKSLVECFKMMSTPDRLHYKEESKEWLTNVIARSAKHSPNTFKALMSGLSQKLPSSAKKKSSPPKQELSSPRSHKSTASARRSA